MSDPIERFDRAFHNVSIQQVWESRRAIVGPANMPPGEQAELAKAGLEALRLGKEPTPKQVAALELVIRMMRPSLLSKRRQIEELPGEATSFPEWDQFRHIIFPKLYTIGRVNNAAGKGIGSGFLVSEKLLVTNRHVLKQLTGGLSKIERGQAKVYFRQEYQTVPDEQPYDVVDVCALHESLDLCVLEIDPVELNSDRELLVLSKDDVIAETNVAVIGYPQDDSFRNPMFVTAIFDGRFNVKRVAPGEVVAVDAGMSVFDHDCSTLGGNSGSPVISLATGQLVGVHAAGYFLLRNESIAVTAVRLFVESIL